MGCFELDVTASAVEITKHRGEGNAKCADTI